jgi:hypothetical protein
MQHARVAPLSLAKAPMQQRDTREGELRAPDLKYTKLTNPKDLITKVQAPMNFRITKPPKTVLISGIPECFAYTA